MPRRAVHTLMSACDRCTGSPPRRGGDCAVVKPLRGEQNDLRALCIATRDLASSNETVKIRAFLDAEREDTRLRCPARSHAGLRDSRPRPTESQLRESG